MAKKINDLLMLTGEEIKNTRVKLNVYNGWVEPIEDYTTNPDFVNVDWLLSHKKRRYFCKGQIVICLVRLPYNHDMWSLTGIKRITEVIELSDGKQEGIGYRADSIDKYSKYLGTVIRFHNNARCIGRIYENIKDELEVVEG